MGAGIGVGSRNGVSGQEGRGRGRGRGGRSETGKRVGAGRGGGGRGWGGPLADPGRGAGHAECPGRWVCAGGGGQAGKERWGEDCGRAAGPLAQADSPRPPPAHAGPGAIAAIVIAACATTP